MEFRLRLLRLSFALQGLFQPNRTILRALKLFSQPRRSPYKDWEQTALAAAKRGKLASGVSYLHYQVPNPKKRALALHGWEGRATHFYNIANVLSADSVEVIALEAVAHGETSGVDSHPLFFQNALLEAQAELGDFDFVLGHSMGAGAMVMALNNGLRVKKAVFISGPATFTEVMWRFCQNINLPKKLYPKFGQLVSQLSTITEEVVDIERLAGNLTVAGLIIHDQTDLLIPFSDAQRVSKNWLTAQVLITKGLGHQRVLRDIAVLEKIRKFLLTN
jgi:hypothetical protein